MAQQKKLCSLVKYSLCLTQRKTSTEQNFIFHAVQLKPRIDDKFTKNATRLGLDLFHKKNQINTDVTVEPKGFVEMYLCLLLLLFFVND